MYLCGTFPHSIDYNTARVVRLLVDEGRDVSIVEVGRAGAREVDGVEVFTEPTLAHVIGRVVRLSPQLIYAQSVRSELVALPFARRRWVHQPEQSSTRIARSVQNTLVRGADVVSFSNPVAPRAWRIKPERILSLPYPIDVAFWSHTVEPDPGWWAWQGTPPSGPVVVHIANLYPVKQQVSMLEAIVPLLQQRTDLTFAIAGHPVDTSIDHQLRVIAAESGVAERIRMLGGLGPDDARQLLAHAKASVINSSSETQCMTMYESLAAGVAVALPAVETLTAAFPDMPVHRNAVEMRNNIERLIDDPALRSKLIERAQERVAWADVRRHDDVVKTTLARLLD